MEVGRTVIAPGVKTPPMPWSVSAESAFVTTPKLNVAEPPAVIKFGVTMNEEIEGVPLQAVCEGEFVGTDEGTPSKLIFTITTPKHTLARNTLDLFGLT